MPTILRRLPFFDEPTVAVIGTDVVAIRPFQIIVWVSITPYRPVESFPAAARLPAVLDIGHSHNFSLQQRHLRDWAGLQVGDLTYLQRARINRVAVPLYTASVWVHPNRPGERDRFAAHPPFRLPMPDGIAVYPPGTPGEPRLPLLGFRALVLKNLHLTIDGRRRRVTLRTARRFWPF